MKGNWFLRLVDRHRVATALIVLATVGVIIRFWYASTYAEIDWEATGKLVSAVVSVATGIFAFVAISFSYRAYRLSHRAYRFSHRQLDANTRISNRAFRHTTSLASINALRTSSAELIELSYCVDAKEKQLAKAEDPPAERVKLQTELDEIKRKFIAEMELFALAINTTVLDIGFANDYLGTFIESEYERVAVMIRQRRNRDPRYLLQWERMLDDLLEIRRAKYVVSQEAIDRLKDDLVNPWVLEVLQEPPFVQGTMPEKSIIAPHVKLLDRKTLDHALHERAIQDDRYSIFQHTMVRQFYIEEFEEAGAPIAGVAEFFVEIFRETHQKYPFVNDGNKETMVAFLNNSKVARRWVALQETATGRKLVGHISCRDLSADASPEWTQVFAEVAKRHPHIKKSEYYVLQEPFVAGDYRNAGGARLLIRRALADLEKEILPAARKRAPAQDRHICLVVVNHSGFKEAREKVYTPDGGRSLLPGDQMFKVTFNVGDSSRSVEFVFFEIS